MINFERLYRTYARCTGSISGEVILLMDDVTTTGNSLYACKEVLLQAGADKAEMF